MSIHWDHGNLLDRAYLVPVIPVNTMGVAGAGLAKQWADRYPLLAGMYQRLCEDGGMRKPGFVRFVVTAQGAAVLFPTKAHWRDPSRVEWIERGLRDLVRATRYTQARYAVPMLGCGLGGLDWATDVRPLVIDALGHELTTFHVFGDKP